MPKATPGIPYVIVTGDNLSRVANQAYGDPSKWRLIWQANQTTLRSNDPNLIYPGEILQIPANPAEAIVGQELGLSAEEYLNGASFDDFTLLIDGTRFLVESARVVRTMDTISDGWSARLPWDPDNPKMADILNPYTFNNALVYLGPRLSVKGVLYTIEAELSKDGSAIVLEGFSPTADLMDSSVKPPYEQKKVTLERRAQELIEPSGLTLIYEADDEEFDRVTASPEDTIFSHLSSLATQRKVLISSTPKGEVIFYQARVGASVGVIKEDLPPNQTIRARFDGRKRFNAYRVIGPTPKRRAGNAIEAVSNDASVPRSRFKTIKADDATEGNIQSIADWQRSKQLIEALTLSFPVNGWYAPNGDLWRENTIVTVESKTIFTPDGFDYLIKSVEYIFDKDGTSAVLSLVPPQVYTGEPLEEPWA